MPRKASVSSSRKKRSSKTDVLVSPMPTEPPVPQTTVTSCTNCAHVPMGVNAVLTLLVALVFTLSAVVVASTFVIDSQSFQIQAYYDAGR